MRLHVYDIESEIVCALSSKPIRSRQVSLYANQVLIIMQIHSAAFRQENLVMKKREQNTKSIIPFSSTSENCKAIVAKATFFTPATNQHQVILPLIKEKALPREPISTE